MKRGFAKLGVLFWGPHIGEWSILGSIRNSLHSGKVPASIPTRNQQEPGFLPEDPEAKDFNGDVHQ